MGPLRVSVLVEHRGSALVRVGRALVVVGRAAVRLQGVPVGVEGGMLGRAGSAGLDPWAPRRAISARRASSCSIRRSICC